MSLTVTLDRTALGDDVWSTSRGHTLTSAEQRFTACDALLTPIVIDPGACPGAVAELVAAAGSPAARSADGGDSPPGGPLAHGGQGVGAGGLGLGGPDPAADPVTGGSPAVGRIAALARTLLGTRIPLAVGRTARTSTPAQRRALAARDNGCIIPGCGIPAEACQSHHLRDWHAGGNTDLPNLALVCWAHHRQVDLGMWTIMPMPGHEPVPRPEPGAPPGTPWPANNGAPWIITRTPRTRWRL